MSSVPACLPPPALSELLRSDLEVRGRQLRAACADGRAAVLTQAAGSLAVFQLHLRFAEQVEPAAADFWRLLRRRHADLVAELEGSLPPDRR